jgi:hypothetical protein
MNVTYKREHVYDSIYKKKSEVKLILGIRIWTVAAFWKVVTRRIMRLAFWSVAGFLLFSFIRNHWFTFYFLIV